MTRRIHRIAALAATMILAACGGGGSGGGGAPASTADAVGGSGLSGTANPGTAADKTASVPDTWTPPDLPAPRAQDIALAPIRQDGPTVHVGTEPSPVASLSPVDHRPGTSWGRIRDGAGRDNVGSYIRQALVDTTWYLDNNWHNQRAYGIDHKAYPGLFRFPSPPTVRIETGTSDYHLETVLQGVQLFNEALPPAWHIRIGPEAPAFTSIENIPKDQIHVFFAPRTTWPFYRDNPQLYDRAGGAAGTSWNWRHDGSLHHWGYIWIHPDRRDDRQSAHLFAHELLHALGFLMHLPDLESTLNVDWADGWDAPLWPLDQEALRAAYMHLDYADDADALHTLLDDWSDTSTHLAGETGAAAFGAAHRNGFVRPWAYGPSPRTNLIDSPLDGNVAWNGELLGFTPAGAPVAGDAAIGIDLSTLRGTASFESLETWTAGAPPGAPGTGNMWGDGDLDYAIAVRGNTFHRTSGADGVLTGIFVGAGHEGAAGTLERDDLSAGFGATRE